MKSKILTGLLLSLAICILAFATITAISPVAAKEASDALNSESYLSLKNYEGEAVSVGGKGVVINGQAYYKKPIELNDSVKIGFWIEKDPTTLTPSVEVAFIAQQTQISFDTFESNPVAGLYIKLNASGEGKVNYVIKWVDKDDESKTEFVGEYPMYVGDYMGKSGLDFVGSHVIELKKSTVPGVSPNTGVAFTEGVELMIDGRKCDSSRLLDYVAWAEIVGTEGLTFAVNTIDTTVEVSNMASTDNGKPIPNDFSMPSSVNVSEYCQFPEIIFTDSIDGVIKHTVTMTDPNLVETVLTENGFLPDYEGIYLFELYSCDYSGNEYIDKFMITATAGIGWPMQYFEEIPSENGRVGVPYVITPVQYAEVAEEQVKTEVFDPKGNPVEITDGAFVPETVGEYRVIYTATNDAGVNKMMVRVYVKYNTDGQNPYEMLFDTEHWVGNGVTKTEAGIKYNGMAYCKVPISMDEGIKITLDISGVPSNTGWVAINFTEFAGFNCYETAFNNVGYFMIIRRAGNQIYYNVSWLSNEGIVQGVAYDSNGGTGTTVTIAIDRVKNNNALPDNIYVNGARNDNFELANSVKFTACVDNENFTYISVANFNGASAVITAIDINDSTAPEFVINGQVPTEAVAINSGVQLPRITAVDAHDGAVDCITTLYSPSGKLVKLINNSFITEEEGIYYYIVQATDRSSNENYKIYQIKVGNTEKTTYFAKNNSNTGCGSSVASPIGICSFVAAWLFARLVKRKEL